MVSIGAHDLVRKETAKIFLQLKYLQISGQLAKDDTTISNKKKVKHN